MEQTNLINLEQKYLQEMFSRNQMLLEAYGEIERLKKEIEVLINNGKDSVKQEETKD